MAFHLLKKIGEKRNCFPVNPQDRFQLPRNFDVRYADKFYARKWNIGNVF